MWRPRATLCVRAETSRPPTFLGTPHVPVPCSPTPVGPLDRAFVLVLGYCLPTRPEGQAFNQLRRPRRWVFLPEATPTC